MRVPGAEDVPCRCGNTGCLEAVAAGPALAARMRAGGGTLTTARTWSTWCAAATTSRSRRCARRAATSASARRLVNLINPSVVVIGGQLAQAGEQLLAGIREAVYRRSCRWPPRICGSCLRTGAEAGVLGAAVMVIEHVLSPAASRRQLASPLD